MQYNITVKLAHAQTASKADFGIEI